jgi:hypothetical protein
VSSKRDETIAGVSLFLPMFVFGAAGIYYQNIAIGIFGIVFGLTLAKIELVLGVIS